jgi:hypothetical protein
VILTTLDNQKITINSDSVLSESTPIKYNRGFFRWILLALVFLPLVLLFFFVGDKGMLVTVDGKHYRVSEFEHQRLINFLNNKGATNATKIIY